MASNVAHLTEVPKAEESSIPYFDTEEWRALRNEKLSEWLQDPYAVEFIVAIGNACEFFDDVVDRDKDLPPAEAYKVLLDLTTQLPFNPFFEQFKGQLVPLLVVCINAWVNANELEQGTDEDKNMAFSLRLSGVELVLMSIYLLRGPEYMQGVSMEVRRLFMFYETLAEYKEKLACR